MAVRHLILIAAVLLCHYSEAAKKGTTGLQPQPSQPQCNVQEQSRLFNSCLMAFGAAHLKDKAAMSRSPTCLRDKLQCRAAGTTVDCINKLPASAGISHACRTGMKETLSYLLMKFGFGCEYKDIEDCCFGSIPDLRFSPSIYRSLYRRRRPPPGTGPGQNRCQRSP